MSIAAKSLVGLALLLFSRWVYRRLTAEKLRAGAVALITGGGSGVGLELARVFSRAGCRVVIVGRNESALQSAASTCVGDGAVRCDYVVADLSSADGAAAVHKAMKALYPSEAHGVELNYLVLNAGAGGIAPFASGARFLQICEDLMNINYLANVRLLQMFLPTLKTTHTAKLPAKILIMSSLAGILPSTLRSGYTASKHAMQGFANALRGEVGVPPITVCCPGYVDTDFHQRVMTADGKPLPGHQRRGIPPRTCAERCVNGMLCGDSEVIFSTSGQLGYVLRPIFTSIVDAMAKRKSYKSIQS